MKVLSYLDKHKNNSDNKFKGLLYTIFENILDYNIVFSKFYMLIVVIEYIQIIAFMLPNSEIIQYNINNIDSYNETKTQVFKFFNYIKLEISMETTILNMIYYITIIYLLFQLFFYILIGFLDYNNKISEYIKYFIYSVLSILSVFQYNLLFMSFNNVLLGNFYVESKFSLENISYEFNSIEILIKEIIGVLFILINIFLSALHIYFFNDLDMLKNRAIWTNYYFQLDYNKFLLKLVLSIFYFYSKMIYNNNVVLEHYELINFIDYFSKFCVFIILVARLHYTMIEWFYLNKAVKYLEKTLNVSLLVFSLFSVFYNFENRIYQRIDELLLQIIFSIIVGIAYNCFDNYKENKLIVNFKLLSQKDNLDKTYLKSKELVITNKNNPSFNTEKELLVYSCDKNEHEIKQNLIGIKDTTVIDDLNYNSLMDVITNNGKIYPKYDELGILLIYLINEIKNYAKENKNINFVVLQGFFNKHKQTCNNKYCTANIIINTITSEEDLSYSNNIEKFTVNKLELGVYARIDNKETEILTDAVRGRVEKVLYSITHCIITTATSYFEELHQDKEILLKFDIVSLITSNKKSDIPIFLPLFEASLYSNIFNNDFFALFKIMKYSETIKLETAQSQIIKGIKNNKKNESENIKSNNEDRNNKINYNSNISKLKNYQDNSDSSIEQKNKRKQAKYLRTVIQNLMKKITFSQGIRSEFLYHLSKTKILNKMKKNSDLNLTSVVDVNTVCNYSFYCQEFSYMINYLFSHCYNFIFQILFTKPSKNEVLTDSCKLGAELFKIHTGIEKILLINPHEINNLKIYNFFVQKFYGNNLESLNFKYQTRLKANINYFILNDKFKTDYNSLTNQKQEEALEIGNFKTPIFQYINEVNYYKTKQMEMLNEANKDFLKFGENSDNALIIVSGNLSSMGNVYFANSYTEFLFGFENNEFSSLTQVLPTIFSSHHNGFIENFYKTSRTYHQDRSVVTFALDAHGHLINIEMYTCFLPSLNLGVLFLGLFRKSLSFKRVKEIHLHSEGKFHKMKIVNANVFKNDDTAVFYLDKDFIITHHSKNADNVLGYSDFHNQSISKLHLKHVKYLFSSFNYKDYRCDFVKEVKEISNKQNNNPNKKIIRKEGINSVFSYTKKLIEHEKKGNSSFNNKNSNSLDFHIPIKQKFEKKQVQVNNISTDNKQDQIDINTSFITSYFNTYLDKYELYKPDGSILIFYLLVVQNNNLDENNNNNNNTNNINNNTDCFSTRKKKSNKFDESLLINKNTSNLSKINDNKEINNLKQNLNTSMNDCNLSSRHRSSVRFSSNFAPKRKPNNRDDNSNNKGPQQHSNMFTPRFKDKNLKSLSAKREFSSLKPKQREDSNQSLPTLNRNLDKKTTLRSKSISSLNLMKNKVSKLRRPSAFSQNQSFTYQKKLEANSIFNQSQSTILKSPYSEIIELSEDPETLKLKNSVEAISPEKLEEAVLKRKLQLNNKYKLDKIKLRLINNTQIQSFTSFTQNLILLCMLFLIGILLCTYFIEITSISRNNNDLDILTNIYLYKSKYTYIMINSILLSKIEANTKPIFSLILSHKPLINSYLLSDFSRLNELSKEIREGVVKSTGNSDNNFFNSYMVHLKEQDLSYLLEYIKVTFTVNNTEIQNTIDQNTQEELYTINRNITMEMLLTECLFLLRSSGLSYESSSSESNSTNYSDSEYILQLRKQINLLLDIDTLITRYFDIIEPFFEKLSESINSIIMDNYSSENPVIIAFCVFGFIISFILSVLLAVIRYKKTQFKDSFLQRLQDIDDSELESLENALKEFYNLYLNYNKANNTISLLIQKINKDSQFIQTFEDYKAFYKQYYYCNAIEDKNDTYSGNNTNTDNQVKNNSSLIESKKMTSSVNTYNLDINNAAMSSNRRLVNQTNSKNFYKTPKKIFPFQSSNTNLKYSSNSSILKAETIKNNTDKKFSKKNSVQFSFLKKSNQENPGVPGISNINTNNTFNNNSKNKEGSQIQIFNSKYSPYKKASTSNISRNNVSVSEKSSNKLINTNHMLNINSVEYNNNYKTRDFFEKKILNKKKLVITAGVAYFFLIIVFILKLFFCFFFKSRVNSIITDSDKIYNRVYNLNNYLINANKHNLLINILDKVSSINSYNEIYLAEIFKHFDDYPDSIDEYNYYYFPFINDLVTAVNQKLNYTEFSKLLSTLYTTEMNSKHLNYLNKVTETINYYDKEDLCKIFNISYSIGDSCGKFGFKTGLMSYIIRVYSIFKENEYTVNDLDKEESLFRKIDKYTLGQMLYSRFYFNNIFIKYIESTKSFQNTRYILLHAFNWLFVALFLILGYLIKITFLNQVREEANNLGRVLMLFPSQNEYLLKINSSV